MIVMPDPTTSQIPIGHSDYRQLRECGAWYVDKTAFLVGVLECLTQFPVLYPRPEDLQLALRGSAAFDLPWFDALIWATAESNGLDVLWTEDLADGRRYGRVRVRNPFLG